MPQTIARDLRTPVATTSSERVGPRRWRKMVLPIGEFQIGDRRLKVTPEYCSTVAAAYADGAYDSVPVMLADKSNDHTMAIRDEGGQVHALVAQPDGLYADVELSNDVDERVARNARTGVSVRIREQYKRADGKFYPAAMQHLLITYDPRIPGMKPWQQLDLSTPTGDGGVVLDLSMHAYEPITDTGGDPAMPFTEEEAAQLRAALPLLARLGADAPLHAGVDTVDLGPTQHGEHDLPDVEGMSDAELEALDLGDAEPDDAAVLDGYDEDWDADDTEGDEAEGTRETPLGEVRTDEDEIARVTREIFGDGAAWATPEDLENAAVEADMAGETGDLEADVDGGLWDDAPTEVAASNNDGDVLELSGRAADQEHVLELSNQLDAANYREERRALIDDLGLPPSVIDAAQPLLQGQANVVELSNGSSVDAGQVVRNVLAEVGRVVKLLDLSEPLGMVDPSDDELDEQRRRGAMANHMIKTLSLN